MRLLLAVLLAAAPALSAQETEITVTALPFLALPALAEMGGASVGRVADDPRAALQNPAVLGLASRDAVQSFGGAPVDPWFGESRYGASAVAWGAHLGTLSVGAALGTGTLRSAERVLADGTPYAPADRFRSLSLGVGTSGAVRMAAGATGRYVTSTDVPFWDGSRYRANTLRGATVDAGVLVAADVARLAGRPAVGPLRPALDVSAGYAQSHVSGGIRYAGFGTMPLPRTGALGWSARAGIDAPGDLRLIEAEFAFSADRVLVERTDGATRYDRLLGGLPLSSAATGQGDDRTIGRRGVRLAVAETVAFSWGRFDGWGFGDVQTRGWEVRTAGLARVASAATGAALPSILQRADLRLGQSTVWAGTDREQTRTTVTLVVAR